MNRDTLLEIWRRACTIHHFEMAICKAVDDKRITAPHYSCLGQEFIPATASMVCSDLAIFAQHRSVGWYLAWGGDMGWLINELLHGPCGSASIHIPGKMFGHDGLMGSNIPIGCGYALATGNPVVIVGGDGAFEEDYALSTIGWAATRNLPVLFLVEDNGLSIVTKRSERRSWDICVVAEAFDMQSDANYDDPAWMYAECRRFTENKLPRLIEVHCHRHRWHCGTGSDGEPTWNRRELVKQEIGPEADVVDEECRKTVEKAWTGRI